MDDGELRNLLTRREIVSAYVLALQRREDLFRLTSSTPGDADAVGRALAETFDVSDVAAAAILDLQVRRFTPESTEQLRTELADLDERVARARGA
jgi:DNA gyrase/topoisomerase IV subunit A